MDYTPGESERGCTLRKATVPWLGDKSSEQDIWIFHAVLREATADWSFGTESVIAENGSGLWLSAAACENTMRVF